MVRFLRGIHCWRWPSQCRTVVLVRLDSQTQVALWEMFFRQSPLPMADDVSAADLCARYNLVPGQIGKVVQDATARRLALGEGGRPGRPERRGACGVPDRPGRVRHLAGRIVQMERS